MRLLLFATITVLGMGQALLAQGSDNHWEFGVRAGVVNYQGDLQRALFTAEGSRPAFGAILRYSYGNHFALRGSMELGNISADDADSDDLRARGFSFESSLFAGELTFEYVPFGKEPYSNGIFNSQLNPYVFTGVGFAVADAEVSTVNPADAARFPEEDDQSAFITVPIGGGLRYSIASGISVGVEANWRPTFSDVLDGVSVNGNPDAMDWFWTFGGYVSFTFGADDDIMNLR